VFEELAKKSDFESIFIDGTVTGVHRHAACAPKKTAPK